MCRSFIFPCQWWNTLHQGASISLTKAPSMAAIMLQGMLVMALRPGFYTIAVALVRVRRIILERNVTRNKAIGQKQFWIRRRAPK
jgi:ABC-type transport system involved in cytochrome c biogenesis permease subunit